jgi:hypothetical protein
MCTQSRHVFLSVLLIVFTGTAFSSSSKDCSNATLEGAFGFSLSGKNIALNGEYVLVGRFEADGKGEYKGAGSQSANGRVARGEFSGTYTVNADCTGSAEITFAKTGVKAQLDFVLVNDGNEIYLIDVGGKTAEFGQAKRLFFRKKPTK